MKIFLSALLSFFISTECFSEDTNLDVSKINKEPTANEGYDLPIHRQALKFDQTNGRRFFIPLQMHGKTKVKIRLFNGHDNSGDNGISWKLVDSSMKTVYGSGFSKSKKVKSWTVEKITTFRPILLIEDQDTNLSGKNPGNPFEIEVLSP